MPSRFALVVCAASPAAALLGLDLGCAGRETKDEVAVRTSKEAPVSSGRTIEAAQKPTAPAQSGGKKTIAATAPAPSTKGRGCAAQDRQVALGIRLHHLVRDRAARLRVRRRPRRHPRRQ